MSKMNTNGYEVNSASGTGFSNTIDGMVADAIAEQWDEVYAENMGRWSDGR